MPPEMLIACRLSKEGFGTPQQILEMDTDIVMAALEYSTFRQEFESTYEILNRPTK